MSTVQLFAPFSGEIIVLRHQLFIYLHSPNSTICQTNVSIVASSFARAFDSISCLTFTLSRSILMQGDSAMGRCLATAVFCYFIFITVISGLLTTAMLVYLLCTSYFWITIVYIIWYIYDFRTCHQGGYQCRWGLYLFPTRYIRDYFPISLVKTADIDCGQNYIFCVHPHGLLCFGGAVNFTTESTGFSMLFPGIRTRLMTLPFNFMVPFGRELQLASGCCAASKQGIECILRREDKGNAAVLVVGGIPEQNLTHPEKMEFYLNNRKGFVKLALKHGAHLVPIINFGENSIVEIDSRSGKRLFRLPLKKPIISVVGKPIQVDKTEEPTSEQILSLHQEYCDALTELYNEHKEIYGFSDIPLVIK